MLKDGASAVYGSDAIGGVINFIMRQDFNGAEATRVLRHADARRRRRPVRGVGHRRLRRPVEGSLQRLLLGALQRAEAARAARRAISRRPTTCPAIGLNTTSGKTFPGFISTGGIGNPGFPDCQGQSRRRRALPLRPRALPGAQDIPETKQLNLFGAGRFQINTDWQAYFTGLYSRQETNVSIQPMPHLRPDLHDGDRHGRVRHPAAADEPVLSARARAALRASTASRSTCAIAASNAATASGRTPTRPGRRWRAQGHGPRLGHRRLGQLQREQHQGDADGGIPLYSRILPLLNSGTREPLRAQHARDHAGGPGHGFTEEAFHAKLDGYGFDLQGLRRNLASCRPVRWRSRWARSRSRRT